MNFDFSNILGGFNIYRKHAFIFILLIMLIGAISAVSAADLNATDTVAADDVSEEISLENDESLNVDDDINSVDENGKLSATNDSEVLATTYYPTDFDDLQSKISCAVGGDTIVLSGTYYFSNTITLSIPLNIVGTDNAVIDGYSNCRLFEMDLAYGNVCTFKDITFINGNDGSGSVFYTTSANKGVSFDNCRFINNTGVVMNRYCRANITNCYFEGNSAGCIRLGTVYNSTFKGNGKPVSNCIVVNCTFEENRGDWSAMSDSRAINCTFIKNRADVRGYAGGGAISASTAINCTFIENSADSYGGAAYESTVINSTFKNNVADFGSGGAAYGCTVVNSTFINNVATRDSGGAMWGGSALNCTFDGNSAKRTGKAVCDVEAIECTFENYREGDINGGTTTNCRFISNDFPKNYDELGSYIANANPGDTIVLSGTYLYTEYSGYIEHSTSLRFLGFSIDKPLHFIGIDDATIVGSAYSRIFNVASDNVTFEGITFKNFNFYANGGVIYANANFTINNCKFINNTANCGGAIYIDGSNVNCKIIDCYFENNHATPIYSNDNTMIVNCIFESNDGVLSSTGIVVNCSFINNSNKIMSGGSAVNCRFENNHNDNHWGVIMSDVSAVNCSFVNNSVRADQGTILRGGSAVNSSFVNNTGFYGTIYEGHAVNCSFINNSAHFCGAMARGSAVNCSFIGNSAEHGAIYDVDAVNCRFFGNYAGYDGGAMNGGSAVNCSFINNSAEDLGGAMRGTSAVNCIFVNNSAKDDGEGGAMYRGSAVNCSFINNSASSMGGAMNRASAVNCSFAGNSARLGGAIYDCVVVNCTLISNYGTKNSQGGAMYLGTATNCTFKGNIVTKTDPNTNSRDYYGGAVCNGNVINCIFESNIADYGGAISFGEYGYNEYVINNCTFINNTAKSGGAIAKGSITRMYSNIRIDIHDSKFINNTALSKGGSSFGNGGALFLEKCNGVISGCSFENNRDDGSGGAIAIPECSGVEIFKCQFNDCYAAKKGGAIYSEESSNLNITYCTFENCTSGEDSTYLKLDNTEYLVSDCIFDEPPAGITYSDRYNPILEADDLSIYVDEEGILNIYLYDILGPLTGKTVILTVDDAGHEKTTDSNGRTSFNIKDYLTGEGNYTVNVRFAGEGLDNPASKNVSVSINRYDSVLNVNNLSCYVGDNGYLIANLSDDKGPLSGKTIVLSINNENHEQVTSQGQATFNIKSYITKSGYYNFTVSFMGDGFNKPASAGGNVNLTRYDAYLTYNNLTIFVNDSGSIACRLYDDRGALVAKRVTVNSNNYQVTKTTNYDGEFTIDVVKDLKLIKSGQYDVSISFAADDYNNPVFAVAHVEINKYDSALTVNNLAMYNGEDAYLIVNLSDVNGPLSGKTIILTVNNAQHTNTTNSNGLASFNIKDYLTLEGNYIVGVSFAGDDSNNPVSANSTVQVSRHDSSLSVNNLSIVKGQDGYLTAYLSDANGALTDRNVVFNINGNDYDVKTDSSGLASINVKDYLDSVGNYVIGISFAGDIYDIGSSTCANVRINNYKGKLSVTQVGTYYNDTYLKVMLVDSSSNQPISNAAVNVIISNSEMANLHTGSDGSAMHKVKSAPSTYNVRANVIDGFVDVDEARFTLVVSEVTGQISVTQINDDEDLRILLYNQNNGDVYRNIPVTIKFDNHDSVELVTNDEGVVICPIPYDSDNPSALISVKGNYTHFSVVAYDVVVSGGGTTPVIVKTESKVSFSSNVIVFDYGSSGNTTMSLTGCTVSSSDIVVIDHPEAVISLEGNNIIVSNLTPGSYNLKVTTNPYPKYYSVNATIGITVRKVDSSVSGSSIVFDYGGSSSTDLTLNGATGVTASVIDHPEANVTVENNRVYVSNLDAGNYKLQVKTIPDSYYNSVTKNIDITVKTVASSVSGKDIVFDYEGSGTTDLTLNGVIGVTASVIGNNKADVSVNGNVITVSNLDAGSYDLEVVTVPDSNHYSVTKKIGIAVNRIDSSVSGASFAFDYLSSGSTTLTVGGGNIGLDGISVVGYEDDATISINSKNVVTVSGLDAGSYKLQVVTTPDANHNSVTKLIDITVRKIASSVSGDDIVMDYEGSGFTKLTVDGGSIVLSSISVLNNPDAIIELDNTNKVTVSNLTADNHILQIVTNPDSNHYSVTKNIGITVNRIDSIISGDDIVMDYMGSGSSELTVVGGSVVLSGLSVPGHDEAIITIADNKVSVSNLSVGTYKLQVISTPDANHNSVTKTIGITVNPIDSTLTFDDELLSFDYGGSGVISVKVNGATIANDGISILGHDEAKTGFKNNKITVSNLNAGNYTLKVVTIPDANHNSISKTVDVIVEKVDSSVGFSNDLSMDYGGSAKTTLTVVGGSVVKDNIIVLNHPEANITLSKNVVSVFGLDVGSYILQVTTTPDSNHNEVTENVDVIVNKVNSMVSFSNPVSFGYGGSGLTTLTVVGGSVVEDAIRVLNHGEANITLNGDVVTVSGLDVGDYTLQVTTTPDSNHNSVTKTEIINVNRADSKLKFDSNVISFDYGGEGSVGVDVTGGIISDSRISVLNYKDAKIRVKDNVIYVSNLNASSYTLQVETIPDSNHYSVTKTITVNVNRVDSNITFNGNVIAYDYGDFGSIGVSVDGGIISIDGVSVVGYDAKPTFKNNRITVSGLDVGNYTLKVTTTPDSNHNSVSVSIGVVVSKTVSKIKYSNEVVFDYLGVGTTTLTLDGCSVSRDNLEVVGYPNVRPEISSANVVSISGLNAGKYTLKVTTAPDGNHIETSINIPVTVNKIDSKIGFTKDSISFKYAKSGSVPIVLENCKVASMSIVGYDNIKPVLKGNEISVSGLAVGNYVLRVTTEPENGNYESVSADIDVIVTKNTASITVQKSQTVAYKKSTQWSITLKDSDGRALSGVKPVLKIYKGNKLYKTVSNLKATDANGVTNYQTSGLPVGTYKFVVSVSHAGYNVNSVSTPVKVIKQTPIKIIVNTKTTKKGGTITVIVKNKAGKKYLNNVKVTLKIKNGNTYKTVTLITGKFANGKGACAYSTNMLTVGSHKVTVTPADIKYSGSGSKTLKIKASAKKYRAWWEKVSKGTKTSSGIK